MFPDNPTMFANQTITIINVIMIFGIVVAVVGALYLLKSNKALHQRALKVQADELTA